MPKVCHRNKFSNRNSQLNCGWMTSCSTEVGREWIRSVGILVKGMYILKMSNSRTYWQCGITTCQDTCWKWVTEGDGSNHEMFFESGFIDGMRWKFVDVLKAVCDKSYSEKHEWVLKRIFALTILERNVYICTSILVNILTCTLKDTVWTRRIKHVRGRVK